jgi:type 1 glutamine amidotransferase
MRLATILTALAVMAAPLAAAPAARILIITGQSDIQYHDWRATTLFLRTLLEKTGRFEVRQLEDPRGLTAAALEGYDAALVSYNGPRWPASAETALAEFVRGGKGLVTFHGVTYGPLAGTTQAPGGKWTLTEPWAAFLDMVGASWAAGNIGHAPRHAFPVQLTAAAHPIAKGMAPEFTVNDELYHKMDTRPGIHVLASAFDDPARGGTGKKEPVAWTVSYGQGRAFHCTLGHDTSALYSPHVMALFARATEWAATGGVTLPAAIDPEVRANDPVRVLVVTGGHSYDPSFYGVFEGRPEIAWSHATSQKEAFSANLLKRQDVLVLYDMYNQIGETEKANLRAFVEAGKGVVALHHAIVDYTSWPWWYEEVIGGKYFEQPSGDHTASHYKEGVPIVARAAAGKQNHPIVRGLGELVTTDECYQGMWHSPRIEVLMETDAPCNDRQLVYLGPSPHTVYIQLGHETFTHEHPGYRQLVRNAILWSAGRLR